MRVRDLKCRHLRVEQILNHAGGTPTLGDLGVAESAVLDGVTAGTVTASKAVVVDANKDVGDFRSLDVVNLDAGASGTAGSVDVFPATASRGKLALLAVNNDGNTTTTISNAAMAQASVVSIPDPGAAAANFLLTSAANDQSLVTATAAELNQADQSAVTGTMSAGEGLAASVGAYDVTTHRTGNIIKTTIYIDLTGLKSVDAAGDVIGDTGVSHIGRITTAVNGVIFAGQVYTAEVPATGDDDIDLYASTAADGAYDDDASGLAGAAALMTAGGALVVGAAHPLTALPAADSYLYLASGAGDTAGTYSAGIIVIELFGLGA